MPTNEEYLDKFMQSKAQQEALYKQLHELISKQHEIADDTQNSLILGGAIKFVEGIAEGTGKAIAYGLGIGDPVSRVYDGVKNGLNVVFSDNDDEKLRAGKDLLAGTLDSTVVGATNDIGNAVIDAANNEMVSSSVDVVNAMNNFTVGPAHNITGGIAAMVGGAQTSAEGLNMIQSVGNEVEKVNSNYSSMISSVVMNIKHNNARMQTIQTELLARGVTIDLPVSHVFSGTTSLIIIKSSALLQKINDIQ